MRFSISSLTIFLFFIWILPLGFFIKPAQEAKACGGQRAICLCSKTEAKVKTSAASAYGFQKSGVSANKEAGSSGGGGHYYLALRHLTAKVLTAFEYSEAVLLSYRNPSLSILEHVPKV